MNLLAYLSPGDLSFWLHGTSAPIWRTLVTLGNSTALNLISAVLASLALGYAIWRLAFWESERRPKAVPYLIAAAFFAVPPFARNIVGLSPMMLSLVPLALAWAILASPDLSEMSGKVDLDDDDDECGRRTDGLFRLMAAGAFAAIAAWESTLGVAFVPLLLLATWMERVCRFQSPTRASAFWLIGFVLAFAIEGLCLGFSFSRLRPVLPSWSGLGVFCLIGIVPPFVIRRFGGNRWTFGGWALALLVSLAVAATTGYRIAESGCESFARKVLGELGSRKFIIGDGFTDDFFGVLKPADVRFLRTKDNADREFMLTLFDGSEPVTNKALVVRQYHMLPEMAAAAEELGLKVRQSGQGKTGGRAKAPKGAGDSQSPANAVSQAVALSNAMERVKQDAQPLLKALESVESELKLPTAQQNRETLEKGRHAIRQAWSLHRFGGTRLSNALLMADIMLNDRQAIETDAITALILDREDPTANGALGALRQEEGRLEAAETYLRKGVKGGGAFPMVKLAMLLVQTDRPKEAVEWARKAVARIPDDLSFREPLVAALIECGQFAEAEAELNDIACKARKRGQQSRHEAFLTGARKRLVEKKREKGQSPP